MMIPDRGDIIYLDFTPQTGTEQAGRRPAIVVSPEKFNRVTGYASVCPISNTKRQWGFHVALPKDLKTSGVIITDQLKNLDFRARNASVIETVPDEVVQECLKKIRTYL
ncbi:type II toxin-antitoxin system PemK/MazF family toxin [Sporosarcina trichiuri]|uniref:type II toxin-antitoxin system PemK/MazF family toxin n=1 Tax=Sporosarcina trichiuri TaxID=3056445 RepID=UPI0025B3CF34|nr:type II toxin-antitoxin system PemK/MazF family toxin [Sporosarcina sp. 0.2-SM1T-5]WJY27335.1 type II toxin-antitoxin system PemK/MazF family toxin [Sporosarcina sp. 0.2-SM1T-5]